MDMAYKGIGTRPFPYKPGPQHNPKGIKRTERIIRSGGCCNQLLLLLILLCYYTIARHIPPQNYDMAQAAKRQSSKLQRPPA